MEDFFKNLNAFDASASSFLGTIDAEGKYSISEENKKHLVSVRKSITSFKIEKIQAAASIEKFKLNFEIELDELSGGKNKKASLYIIEKPTMGFLSESIRTFIVSYTDENNGAFIEKIKKAFSLFTVDETDGKDMSNLDSKLLEVLKNGKTQIEKKAISFPEKDKDYVLKVLTILKAYGTHGNDLIKTFKINLAGLKLDKFSKDYWNKAKNILDKTLMAAKIYLVGELLTELTKLQTKYLNDTKELPKEEKKAEKKKDNKKDVAKKGGGGPDSPKSENSKIQSYNSEIKVYESKKAPMFKNENKKFSTKKESKDKILIDSKTILEDARSSKEPINLDFKNKEKFNLEVNAENERHSIHFEISKDKVHVEEYTL